MACNAHSGQIKNPDCAKISLQVIAFYNTFKNMNNFMHNITNL